ncbi:MAG: TAXI family TRAP transporter solute-binding subunit [Burkholderiaceae bacterium]
MPTIDPPPPDRSPAAPVPRRNRFDRIADRFHFSWRDTLVTLVPVVLLLALVGYVAQRFVRPAPPSTIVMTTGTPGGAYDAFARRYQSILARSGVTLELHPSSGAVENYDRLRAPPGHDGIDYDVGFIQSGIGSVEEAPHLETIAGVYYEPVWLFSRHLDNLARLSDLRGKRIGVGIPGSGLRRLSVQMLAAAGVNASNATLVEVAGTESAKMLEAGELDIAFIIGAPESPYIQSLFKGPLHLVNLAQSEAIARYFPTLTPQVLPQGAVDLADARPEHDIKLLAATSLLVSRDDLHPALVYLLLEAASEVHGGPGLFQRRGEFPSSLVQDFPVSEQAQRWFQSGRPFLQRYLPFWLANLIERLLVVIVPIVALTIPLMRIVPAFYSWRVRSKIFRWYGELHRIEMRAIDGDPDANAKRLEARRLDEIETSVSRLKIPLAFYHEVHLLRAHIDMVRLRLGGETVASEARRDDPRGVIAV